MSKKRTKKQKIKAQHLVQKQLPIIKKTVSQNVVDKSAADLLMSQPAELKGDLIKTIAVTLICLLVLAGLCWQFK